MNKISFERYLDEHGALCWGNVGISMLPLLREGRDVMRIEKYDGRSLRRKEVVLFRRQAAEGDLQYVLHRILRVNSDGTYWVVGDHCTAGDTVAPEDILGVMTGVVRGKNELRVTDPGYRLYASLWCALYPVRAFLLRSQQSIARLLARCPTEHKRENLP